MAKERTFGYHPTEEPRIFEIDRAAGETLPAGWVDTPSKLAPKSTEVAAADVQADVVLEEGKTAHARIDELAAELAALNDIVNTLQRPAPKRRRRRRAAKRRAREVAATGAPPGEQPLAAEG